MRGAFGDAVDGWAGKIVVVFPTMAEFRGKMGPALRVRIPPPKQQWRHRQRRRSRVGRKRTQSRPDVADDVNDPEIGPVPAEAPTR